MTTETLTRPRAGDTARQSKSLGRTLEHDSPRFSLLPALALLEHFATAEGAPPLGEETRPASAAVALVARAGFGFPASEIDHIDLVTPARAEITGPACGLLGHIGPLPDWVTEELAQRVRRGDRAATDFLAMFEQRLMTVAFRARARTEPGFAWRPPEDTALGGILRALIGLATPGLRRRLAVPDRALFGFAGLLAGQSRSLGALERVLRTYLRAPFRVIPFTGRWLAFDPADVSRVSAAPDGNHLLGRTALLGARVWDRQSCFTLRIGPLDPPMFRDLMPDRAAHRALAALTRFFAGPGLDFQLELHLDTRRIGPARLSAGDAATRLGWTSFLVARPDTRAAGIMRVAARDTTTGALA
jgi:type VI secretion system protein ImpH